MMLISFKLALFTSADSTYKLVIYCYCQGTKWKPNRGIEQLCVITGRFVWQWRNKLFASLVYSMLNYSRDIRGRTCM